MAEIKSESLVGFVSELVAGFILELPAGFVGSAEACAYSRVCGRKDAIEEVSVFEGATDRLFKKPMATPCTTRAGRAAKVRPLITHVMPSSWPGPANELDWDKEMARALLGEFVCISAEAEEVEQI